MSENKSNPNGANGTTSDPREQIMWDNYIKSITNGRESAKQAALDAGYEEATASQITVRSWFLERKEKLKRKEILSKAEKVLEKTLTYSTDDEEGKVKTDLLRIQTDVAKFVASTQGKDKGYSTRTEVTGEDGKAITITFDPSFNKDDPTR